VNRRAAIRMSAEEARAFLEAERTMVCATNGRDGWPHLMPLWYVPEDGRLWAWTYAKSQKARNLERDPRATLQVEAGTTYDELRGVMLRTEAVLHRDPAVIERIAMALADRYAGPGPEHDAIREGYRRQVPKRVVLEFAERGRVTWDHRKL
jgi:PPOX class probable F420-dependent enzyme